MFISHLLILLACCPVQLRVDSRLSYAKHVSDEGKCGRHAFRLDELSPQLPLAACRLATPQLRCMRMQPAGCTTSRGAAAPLCTTAVL